MSSEQKVTEEKQIGLLAMLAIIALLLAGVLVALVILIVRVPPRPRLSDGAPNSQDLEDSPAESTSVESRPEAVGEPVRGERPDTVIVISGERIYKRITYETGVFSLSAPTQVLLEPKANSTIFRLLPEGATFAAIGRQGEYRLIQWTERSESLEGWVLVAPTQALTADRGGMAGTVRLSGHAPAMHVPTKRKSADFCKSKDIVHNAVIVNDGKLQDVLVRIAPRSVPGQWKAPHTHAVLEQQNCVYAPRIQGVVLGQAIDILNNDETLHNVHAYKGVGFYFNQAQPRGAAPITKEMPNEPSVMRFECDLHPWARSFVVVTDHPFFAVTDEDGRFVIQGIPPGKYAVEALHTQYGVRRLDDVVVTKGSTARADFTFTTSDLAPDWNPDELTGLW